MKYASASFGVMAPPVLVLQSQAALLKICVITGWVLPEDEFLDILTDQFSKKMVETYPNINPDEFEYAFRTYGTAVKDWGKQINLSLIGQVLAPYLTNREHISQVEAVAKAREANKQEAPKEDLSDHAMREWLSDARNKVNTGGYSFQFLPMMLYTWLVKKGKLNKTAAQKANYLQLAVAYRKGLYQESLEKCEDPSVRARLRSFTAMVEAGEITGEEIATVEGITRRMILFDYLKTDTHDLDT